MHLRGKWYGARHRSAWFGLLLMVVSAAGWTETSRPVATFDWGIAETLLALDVAPVAMGSVHAFHDWTGDTYASSEIIDVGVQTLPNLELLDRMSPRRILLPPRHRHREALMSRLGKTARLDHYPYAGSEGDFWPRMRAFTEEAGELVGKAPEARRLIRETAEHFDELASRLNGQAPPLLVVQLQDERHLRVYGEHSLFQAVLERLGLKNAWQGSTNQWGYTLVGLDELLTMEARLVIIEGALPVGIERRLSSSGMWRLLPSVRRGDTIVLPSSFWIAGTLPSANRFAEALVEALAGAGDG